MKFPGRPCSDTSPPPAARFWLLGSWFVIFFDDIFTCPPVGLTAAHNPRPFPIPRAYLDTFVHPTAAPFVAL